MKNNSDIEAALAANLSSRICHDLVSPVGAIANGVDLIREIGAGNLTEEFGLISQSADRASSLLKFYRLAFGATGTEAADVARGTLVTQAKAMFASPRITLTWQGEEGPALSRAEARLACLLLLCARSVTGMTGTILVAIDPMQSFPMVVSVDTSGSAEASTLLSLLVSREDVTEITPKVVEFLMARDLAQAAGITLSVKHEPARIVLGASQS